jgi:hypothetical protein
MKTKIAILLAGISLCGVFGCSTKPPRQQPSAPSAPVSLENASDITQVRVVIIRELLKDHPADKLAFLSNGRGEGPGYASVKPEVMEQLADVPFRILVVGWAKPPRLGEGGPVIHKETGEPGYIYTAIISEWNGPNIAMVEGQKYDGAVPVSGFTGIARRIPNADGTSTWELATVKKWRERP